MRIGYERVSIGAVDRYTQIHVCCAPIARLTSSDGEGITLPLFYSLPLADPLTITLIIKNFIMKNTVCVGMRTPKTFTARAVLPMPLRGTVQTLERDIVGRT